MCQATYHAGMQRLLRGDRAGAWAYFQICLKTKRYVVAEYILAQAELTRLR
jgi:hypothetical protein